MEIEWKANNNQRKSEWRANGERMENQMENELIGNGEQMESK